MIPPVEVREAIQRLATNHVGVGRDEMTSMVARALGFKATGAKLRDVIESALKQMVDADVLELRDERLYLR